MDSTIQSVTSENGINFTSATPTTYFIVSTADDTTSQAMITSTESPNVGAVVGGVIGGLAGLVLIIFLAYFCWKRRKLSSESSPEKPTSSPTLKNDTRPTPAAQKINANTLPDASPGYDSVVPAVDRNRYSNSEAFQNVNIEVNNTDTNDDDGNAIYVNDPSYVNLDQARGSPYFRGSHCTDDAPFYDNLPALSRNPSSRRGGDDDDDDGEDEYVAMNNLQ